MPPFPHAGEMMSLLTALFWSLSAMIWGLAGRRIGSVPVTTLRAAFAAVILAGLYRVLSGAWWPSTIGSTGTLYFIASGVLGAGIGDLLLFRSLLLIGPRLGMLVLALAPIFSAFLAWATPLHEVLTIQALAGIVITVGGVAWVVGSGRHPVAVAQGQSFATGVWFAVLGTFCIAAGFVLSRMGFAVTPEQPSSAWGATYIRVVSATLCCLVSLPLLGQTRRTIEAFRDRKAIALLLVGTVIGPVVGIWLSMVSLKWAPAGIVTALMSTAPVMMIPIAWAVDGDRPTWHSFAGTCLAVAGAALLVLR